MPRVHRSLAGQPSPGHTPPAHGHGGGGLSPPLGSVLALQRRAGNQAVAALAKTSPLRIARDQTVADVDRQFQSHVHQGAPDWDAAVHDLDALSDHDIAEHVRDLAPAELPPLLDAAWKAFGMRGQRISGPVAERLFRLAVQRRDWPDAGLRLVGLDDGIVNRLLIAIDPDDLMNLDDGVLKATYPAVSALAAPIRVGNEPRRLADLDRRYHDALGRKSWTEAAKLLETYPDADIERIAGQITATEDLEALEKAAIDELLLGVMAGVGAVLSRPPHAERVQLHMLQADWDAARTAEDFRQLVILTARFKDADKEAQLGKLRLTELEGMQQAVLHEPFLLAPLLYAAIMRHRALKQKEMLAAALTGNNLNLAAILLGELQDADANAAVDALTAPQFTALGPLVRARFGDDNAAVRRFNYQGWKPTLATAHPVSTSGGVTGKAGDPSVPVPGGGTVTTHANDSTSSGQFGQDYQGPGAQSMGWIQFLEREAEQFGTDGTSLGFDTSGSYTARGQTEKRSFGSPADPAWTVDTLGGTLPFYDSPSTVAVGPNPAGSAGITDANAAQQAMWDMPGSHPEIAVPAFDHGWFKPDVAQVVIRFRFVQYLVNGPNVVMKSGITVTWTYTAATAAAEKAGGAAPARVNTALPSVPSTKIDAEHYEALLRRFPTFRFLAHG